jgi:hypothetical protein
MNSKRLNTIVITNKKRDTAQGIITNDTNFFLGRTYAQMNTTLSASCLCWLHEPTANTQ